jgi:hypothetical protein
VRITRSLYAIIAAILIAAIPLASPAQFTVGVGLTIGVPPPVLPVYSMPPAPYPNYQWQPGYWAWGPAGYYWVPGTWIAPPSVGVYWTPGYWGYNNGYYGWNTGYWGPSVGFYGGVNYGFGYYGTGFVGGVWAGNAFRYNTAVVNVNRTVINNTYINKTVINRNVNCGNNCHVSYNGGHGGISARPTSAQIDARRGGIAPTTAQRQQAQVAGQDRNLYANVNKGKPPVTAVAKPVTDPHQLPKYAPVTPADKQAAEKSVKPVGTTNKAPTTTNKAMTTNKGPTTTTPHHNAPVSQSEHQKPPTTGGNAMHTQGGTHGKPQGGQGKPNAMHQSATHGQSGGAMHGQPGGAMHGQPGGQGKPPSAQGKPPAGGGQGKPPGGGDKNKPPRG